MPRIAGVLLAAGLSRRFGDADKLVQPLDGMALGVHAARALARLPLACRIAVTAGGGPDYAADGFTVVVNPAPADGQGRSLALGVAAAHAEGADAVLVALADMPHVGAAHWRALLARYDGAATLVASCADGQAMPPALFGAAHFPALVALTGDRGARALLDRATLIAAPAAMLVDIDTPDDLAAP